MAIYRQIYLTFWTDTKIVNEFTPEDKYFYLYLMTNPHTNLCGCYEVSIRQMSWETGYNEDTISHLLERFTSVHKVIQYNKETREILLLHWHKYNWTKSPKLIKSIEANSKEIKDGTFRKYVTDLLKNDILCIPYTYPMHTSVPDTVPDSVADTVPDPDDIRAYVKEKNYKVDPDRFYSYYKQYGFPKDWKAQVDYWEQTEFKKSKPKHTNYIQRDKETKSFGTDYLKELRHGSV